MTQLLVPVDAIETELAVIQTVLAERLKDDMQADPLDSLMSEGQVDTVNIALRNCLGKRKLPNALRYRILAELCGRNPSKFKSSKMMGKRVASEFISWVYGPSADVRSHPTCLELPALVLQHLYDSLVEVRIG